MILVAPILLPLLFIILSLIMKKNSLIQKISGLAGAVFLLIFSVLLFVKVNSAGIQVMHMGEWPAPYGITMVADLFSALMILVSGIIGFCSAVYSFNSIDHERHSARFFLFFHAMLMGVNGVFLTGDVFNMYVWFEVMLISSFVLMTLGNRKLQLEGAIKYVVLNLVSSLLFFAGAGLLYGQTGTLNIADLALQTSQQNFSGMNISAVLFFIAFGIKSAVFPFFFWLPASYHTPPVAVTAFFSGLLTKAGAYAMIRFFTMIYASEVQFWNTIFIITAAITMIIGVITAAPQNDIRKLLLFHIVSQMGYILMGLGIYSSLAISGTIYFILHNAIAKTNIFFVAGLIKKAGGSYSLDKLGELQNSRQLLALLFFIPAIALAGIPPLSGFFGKYMLAKAGLDAGKYFIAGVSLFVGLMTLFYMIRIWNGAFLKPRPENVSGGKDEKGGLHFALVFPSAVLGLVTIALGIGAGYILPVTSEAAGQLLNANEYIEKVLGK